MNLDSYWTNDNPRNVWTLTDDAPEWLRGAVQGAHGELMPDDWTFDRCRGACLAIDESIKHQSTFDPYEYADRVTDVYHRGLAGWYASVGWKVESEHDEIESVSPITTAIQRLQFERIAFIAGTIFQAYRESL